MRDLAGTSNPQGIRRAGGIVPSIMGRHPDPRPGEGAVTPPELPADPAPPPAARRRRRGARLAGRFVVLALAIALGGWAALNAAGAATAERLDGIATAATPSIGNVASASSRPTTTPPSPAPGGSPAAASPPATPQVPLGAAEPLTRPRVTTVPVGTRLQAELDRLRTRLGIPGVSVTVIFRDGTSWTGASGLADVKGRLPVEDETAFAVGSVSKTYTAALVLALAGDGKIDLDKPAAAYLPQHRLDKRITVRMLLDHTSGLDDFFLHPAIDVALQKAPAANWSTARTLKYVKKPYFPPGTGYHYSNTNYLYLGLIAEAVTKTTLGKALHDRFFGPLGLDATWYEGSEKPRARTAHGYRLVGTSRTAPPIDLSDGTGIVPFTSVVTAAAGAGSIATTSQDAAAWARLLYTGKVLGPEMTAQMIAGTASTAAYRPPVPYGLGVQAFPIDGRATVGHSGRLLGFRAAIRYLPGEATTIAVLTNQSRADPGVIVRSLLGVVFAPEPDCFRCPFGSPS
jgi:D-alanyl-D-alanine carboxypeptidase